MVRSVVLVRLKRLWEERQVAVLDYFWTFLATGLIQVIGVITGVLTARLLGPAGRGDLATVYWLPALMVTVGILSLPQAVAYQVSRMPAQDKALTAVSFWLSLGLGLVEAAVLYPLIPFILGQDKQYLVPISRWFLLYLPASFSGLVLLGIDQGRQAFSRFNILRLLPVVLYLIGLLALWGVRQATLQNIVIANLSAQVFATAIRAAVAGRYLLPAEDYAWRELVKSVLERGWTFLLPTLSGILLMRVDMALLIRMVPANEVGFYSVAMSIAIAQIGVSSSLVQVNFPKVAASTPRQAREVLSRQFRWALPPIVGMAILVGACSPLIIRYLFGSAFLPALPPTFVLMTAMAVWSTEQVLENGLRSMGYGVPGAIANSLGLVVLIASAIPLIGALGITGMAIALLISVSLVLAVLWGIFRNLK